MVFLVEVSDGDLSWWIQTGSILRRQAAAVCVGGYFWINMAKASPAVTRKVANGLVIAEMGLLILLNLLCLSEMILIVV